MQIHLLPIAIGLDKDVAVVASNFHALTVLLAWAVDRDSISSRVGSAALAGLEAAPHRPVALLGWSGEETRGDENVWDRQIACLRKQIVGEQAAVRARFDGLESAIDYVGRELEITDPAPPRLGEAVESVRLHLTELEELCVSVLGEVERLPADTSLKELLVHHADS